MNLPKVALTTLGCKVNQFETESMEGLFKQRGYTIVPFEEKADFYVINTCSVTSLGDRKSRQIIRRAQRQNEQAVIAVCGCYAQVHPEEIKAMKGSGSSWGPRSAATSSSMWSRRRGKTAFWMKWAISWRRRTSRISRSMICRSGHAHSSRLRMAARISARTASSRMHADR